MKVTFEDGNTLRFTVHGREDCEDYIDVLNVTYWLFAFASPRGFQQFSRSPPREHVLYLIDIYIAYVNKGAHYAAPQFQPVHYERRAPLAARLRELFEAWSPPELPREVVDIARALIECEGIRAPACGWDAYEGDEGDGLRFEDTLLWPEGVPALLNKPRAPER